MMRATLIILSFLIISCSSPESTEQNEESYIDLNAWVKGQIQSLQGSRLLKTSYWNDLGPNDTLYGPDWARELRSFDNIPLTPSSWRTDYTAVVEQRDSLKSIQLTPKGHLNELRSARIEIVGDAVYQIELEYQYENMLKRNRRNLRFTSGLGYEISGVQKTRFFPEENYRIIGKFEAAK